MGDCFNKHAALRRFRFVNGDGEPGCAACWMTALQMWVVSDVHEWRSYPATVSDMVADLCVFINDYTHSSKRRTKLIRKFGFQRPLNTCISSKMERKAVNIAVYYFLRYLPEAVVSDMCREPGRAALQACCWDSSVKKLRVPVRELLENADCTWALSLHLHTALNHEGEDAQGDSYSVIEALHAIMHMTSAREAVAMATKILDKVIKHLKPHHRDKAPVDSIKKFCKRIGAA